VAKQTAPVPAGPSAYRRARSRRLYSTILWWIFVGLFIYNAIALGQAFFWIPAVAFGAGAIATTRLALSPRAPEKATPEPGALAAARKGAVVEAPATWVAREGGRPQPARPGTLRFADAKLSFTTDDGEGGFEAPVKRLRLATVPGFLRPQLDVEVGGDVHTIRFFAMWDLGATFVGPVVAMEWYRQLRALGAG
jgi:hypothetical protein